MELTLEMLERLNHKDVISDIDLEFCRYLQQVVPSVQEQVMLAACLTSMAYREGNICLVLDDYAGGMVFTDAPPSLRGVAPPLDRWTSALAESPVVGRPGDYRPLILDGEGRLYLQKLWMQEQRLISGIQHKLDQQTTELDTALLREGLDRLFGADKEFDWQKVAAAGALLKRFLVISGGPGTGKTTTVVRILALLAEQRISTGRPPSIALAAPTGKAAARLETAIEEARGALPAPDAIKDQIPAEAVTLHQLLGARRHTATFRYNSDNRLPYDTVVVDEVSMVDQDLMSRLMDALRPAARLILLGDKDQLASVEAGSILGDICGSQTENRFTPGMGAALEEAGIALPQEVTGRQLNPLTDHIVLLQKSYRFGSDSGIGQLAHQINAGEEAKAWSVLEDERFPDVTATAFEQYGTFEQWLYQQVKQQFEAVRECDTAAAMLQQYQRFKILAAHRRGPWGIHHINDRMERMLRREGKISPYEEWYAGRPIIITTNDYSTGLSNGDMGVCMPDGEGGYQVCFSDGGEVRSFAPARIPAHHTAFALTVHKSQGSEFDRVLLVLPDQPSRVLCRELLYTAVTRARSRVKIYGSPQIITQAITRTIARSSGLQAQLWNGVSP